MINRLQSFSNPLTVNNIENIIYRAFDDAYTILSVLGIDEVLAKAKKKYSKGIKYFCTCSN